ncbi:hypothetical protein QOT17_023406 [Balamuthia mandrillaris]
MHKKKKTRKEGGREQNLHAHKQRNVCNITTARGARFEHWLCLLFFPSSLSGFPLSHLPRMTTDMRNKKKQKTKQSEQQKAQHPNTIFNQHQKQHFHSFSIFASQYLSKSEKAFCSLQEIKSAILNSSSPL